MYAAPYPLSGSLSVRNNNAIGLAAYGYDLLETGRMAFTTSRTRLSKSMDRSRIFNSESQRGTSWPYAHRERLHVTSDWRWHSSAHVDVVEGIYAGNFGREKKLDDVRHQRVVQYVRKAGVWIVTDRLNSPSGHKYTLDWRFGLSREMSAISQQNKSKLKPRKAHQNRASRWRERVALSFSLDAYNLHDRRRAHAATSYRLHDFLRVSGDWKAQNQSVVVTAIYPRRTLGEELTSIKPLSGTGVQGFEATLQKGIRVLYQAATLAPAP
jgi:hypothetical protein